MEPLPSFGSTQFQTSPVQQPNIVSQLAGLGVAGATIADTFGYNPFASGAQNSSGTADYINYFQPSDNPYNQPIYPMNSTQPFSPSNMQGDGNPMTRDLDTFLDPQYSQYSSGGPA